MASPALAFGVASRAPESPFARRLAAEAELLVELVGRNPRRLALPLELRGDDRTLRVTLCETPARTLGGAILCRHDLRLEYPKFFPALPLELYLETPIFHPNVHPETGFVCLWDRHRAAHTAEDAVHKTAAILGWRLFNFRPEHTMQPACAALAPQQREGLAAALTAAPLVGVRGASVYPPAEPGAVRRRLS